MHFDFKNIEKTTKTVVIADSNVPLMLFQEAFSFVDHFIFLQGGESCKTREHKAEIEDKLFSFGCGKETCLIAIGGGSILDLVGFVAATYMRGVRLIFVPTTLLAMLDASIGGKNGINTPWAKNCIGTIYEPENVYVDMNFLSTLSEEKKRKDLIEGYKHSLLKPFPFPGVSCLKKPQKLWKFIQENIQFKKYVVAKEISEKGYRDILNLGHTFGHAIEFLEEYAVDHATAVAIGIQAEISLGDLEADDIGRIRQDIDALEIPLSLRRPYTLEEWKKAFTYDKKTKTERPHFVLFDRNRHVISKNGKWSFPVDEARIIQAIHWVHARCCIM